MGIDSTAQEMELLEAERNDGMRKIVDDFYAAFFDKFGFSNAPEITDRFIQIEKLLRPDEFLATCRNDDGTTDAENVYINLVAIFEMGTKEIWDADDEVFNSLNMITREDAVALFQRAVADIAGLFREPGFDVERRFIETAATHYGVYMSYDDPRPKPASRPPRAPSSRPAPTPVPQPQGAERMANVSGRKGNVITASFQSTEVILGLLEKLELETVIEHYPEDEILLAAIPKILKMVERTLSGMDFEKVRSVPSSMLAIPERITS